LASKIREFFSEAHGSSETQRLNPRVGQMYGMRVDAVAVNHSIAKLTGGRSPIAHSASLQSILSEIEDFAARWNSTHLGMHQIPPSRRTKHLTKAEAAKYLKGEPDRNPSIYIKREVAKGATSAPIGNGQRWQFDINDFPPEAQDELRQI
jgi:hypothetical protein